MALIEGLLTVREALEYLRLNGSEVGEVYLRILLASGRIKSARLARLAALKASLPKPSSLI